MNKIVPLFPSNALPSSSDSNQPADIRELKIITNYRETGTDSKYEVKTNQGNIKGFSETDANGSTNQLYMVGPLGTPVSLNNQGSVPVSQDITIHSNNQIAISAVNALVVKTVEPAPYTSATTLIPLPDKPYTVATLPSDPFNFSYFQQHVKSKLCYNSDPIDTAMVTKSQDRVAYWAEIWTLMEYRSVKTEERPYKGESVGGQVVGNLFDLKDLPIQTPQTDIEGTRETSCPLVNTQRKVICSQCNGKGKQQCASCAGQGHLIPCGCGNDTQCSTCHGTGNLNCTKCVGACFLLRWEVLTIKWETIQTVSPYQNTFLPKRKIRFRPKKKVFFDADHDWTNHIFLTNYPDLYETIATHTPPDMAKKFGQDIQKQYQTHYARLKPSTIMRKMKILIRQVNIIEVDYQLEGYTNKNGTHKGTNTFNYLVYGCEENGKAMIYENNYPLNCCGCLGPKAACRCNCSIS
ncbi:unnamed protein product [Adineta steineri]|uniref:Uncharacterized protein n=1 Tax=Adineta steineri TaxID=433720 RepID=A0A813V810_9BILA|nr:unnamed protein product [Adineta steineri]CAF0752935.1 unnamed protein product [Adineta steineri]CAF0832888.1 unnamed protein product [Adineta steineri]